MLRTLINAVLLILAYSAVGFATVFMGWLDQRLFLKIAIILGVNRIGNRDSLNAATTDHAG